MAKSTSISKLAEKREKIDAGKEKRKLNLSKNEDRKSLNNST